MWTLIITVVLNVSYQPRGGAAVTHVPGFQTKEACTAAAYNTAKPLNASYGLTAYTSCVWLGEHK